MPWPTTGRPSAPLPRLQERLSQDHFKTGQRDSSQQGYGNYYSRMERVFGVCERVMGYLEEDLKVGKGRDRGCLRRSKSGKNRKKKKKGWGGRG